MPFGTCRTGRPRRCQYRRQALALLLALGLQLVLPASARASHVPGNFHSYSVAIHAAQGNQYSGVQVQRTDVPVTVPFPHCIYEPQWATDAATGQWVEIGSAWGANCVVPDASWYWGIGIGGTYYHDGGLSFTPSQQHVFSLFRSGGTYYYYVDSTWVGDVAWSRDFPSVKVGLESYMSGAVYSAQYFGFLKYSLGGGAYQYWNSQHSTPLVDVQMCGFYQSDTLWRAGQNVTC